MLTSQWYADLATAIRRREPRCGPVSVVAVDGVAGAGKSTLAAGLARALDGAPIVPTDGLASHQRLFDWWPELVADVFEPLAAGRPGSYRPYDWVARRRGEPHAVPVVPVLIVEGVGAGRRELAPWLSYLIWMDADPAAAHDRGLRRDLDALGAGWEPELAEFWTGWVAAEQAHFAADPTADRADLNVPGRPT
ncbi:MAG: uridine kinase [Sporichthyaceae bacterium]|nr:uridine kinase [Sporichthyaceae bacterium]